MPAPYRIMPVYGTRPEAIKMAPLILALKDAPQLEDIVVVTGQHREMLDQVNEVFGIVPDMDLDIFEHGMSLNGVIEKTLSRLGPLLQSEAPDAVVVQGDTTSALAAGLAAFNAGIPVIHLEAGLRTASIASPFPEEGNRRLLSQITRLHLAPTPASRQNLLRSGVPAEDIVIAGNTVIDALHVATAGEREFLEPALRDSERLSGRVVLVTSHRRESWGDPMRRTASALARLATERPDVTFVFPLHANPRVREIFEPVLGDQSNVILTESLAYPDLALMLARADIVVTDSGGIQEEAPALGKPVLVLREDTERPEAIDAGTARLVGTDPDLIVSEVHSLLDDPAAYEAMAMAVNPFGDGRAAERSVAAISAYFGEGERMVDFDPHQSNESRGPRK
ncbi:MAG: non-hydrolyzing UDP-N-acetylglucosamine 2-epimerase [Demequina sp.]